MNELRIIAERAAEKKLPFLVIGGHAVVAHGYPRRTFDLDIVIPKSDSKKWKELVSALGYTFRHEGPAFLQFDHANLKGLPLDILLTSDEVFGKFMTEAVSSPPNGGGAKVIALLHLIALKRHAVKYGHERRIVKDADDVIRLMEANRLDPEKPEIRAVFLKHGNAESANRNNSTDFELPDWSGMDDSPWRISIEEAFARCGQVPEFVSIEAMRKWQEQRLKNVKLNSCFDFLAGRKDG